MFVDANTSTQHKAQNLNNNAALLIESGKLDEALLLLKQTLDYVKEHGDQQECRSSALDECIATSQEESCETISMGSSAVNTKGNSYNYIYKRPIRVNCDEQSIGGNMQSIITFNIALAHHLKALRGAPSTNSKQLIRTLSLYELAHQMQRFYTDGRSFYFEMIILGNIGHIHNVLNNKQKCNWCLRQLMLIEAMVNGLNQDKVSDLSMDQQLNASYQRSTVLTSR